MQRATRLATVLAPAALLACGPPPVMTAERAREICWEEIDEADGVFGDVGVVIGSSGGARVGGSVTITNRILDPETPGEALRNCIRRVMDGGQARRPGPTFGITLGTSR